MAKARIVRQLVVEAPNEVGTLGRLCRLIADLGANILHMCGSSLSDNARFMFTVDRTDEVKAALLREGYDVSEAEAVEVELDNAPGSLEPVASVLADHAVDITYHYATTNGAPTVKCIIATNDNQKARELIEGLSG